VKTTLVHRIGETDRAHGIHGAKVKTTLVHRIGETQIDQWSMV